MSKRSLFLIILITFFLNGCVEYIKRDILELESKEESIWPDIKNSSPLIPKASLQVSPEEARYDIPLQINGKVEKFIHYYQNVDREGFLKEARRG